MSGLVVRVQPFGTAVLRRSAFTWLAVRIFVAVCVAFLGELLVLPPHPLLLSPVAGLGVVLTVGAIGLMDARRRNEDLFLANLGVSRTQIAVTAAMPALVLELLLAAVKYQ
jgi:hypothetical protein